MLLPLQSKKLSTISHQRKLLSAVRLPVTILIHDNFRMLQSIPSSFFLVVRGPKLRIEFVHEADGQQRPATKS